MQQGNKIIVVNSTAAVNGGALTILNEFCSAIINLKIEPVYEFIFFTSIDLDILKSSNIRVINIGENKSFKRILWDYYNFKKFLKRHNIHPNLIMSFQNTGVVYDKNCPQLIYYHNSICLTPHKWNPLKKSERVLWFYTKIYPAFVKALINSNSRFIVQANWIKDAFSKKFNVLPEKIKVVLPSVKQISVTTSHEIDKKIIFFFPATAFVYKNHRLLLNMMSSLKQIDPILFKEIKLILTLTKHDIYFLGLKDEYENLQENILLTGYINKEDIIKIYSITNILLFPSKIETFGLPLVEAASLNKFILCSDAMYAHETLLGYNNVIFLDNMNSMLWAKHCYNFITKDEGDNPISTFRLERRDTWQEVFRLIKKIIN